MLSVSYACLLWLATCLWGVGATDPEPDAGLRNSHRDLAPANVDFAFSLYKHLVASVPTGNVLISPVSVSMALAMLALGAGGATRTQLLQGLGFNLTETPEASIHSGFQHLRRLLGESGTSLEMAVGSALLLDHRLQPQASFSAAARHYYASEALVTNFQDWARVSSHVNKYVKNKTQGKISEVLLELDTPATLILVNYIFLKGTWAVPFDLERTSEEDFHVSETSRVKVPMMSRLGLVRYLNDSLLPCQLVQLDYIGNGTAFFILPERGHMDTVIAALSRDTIQRWSDSLTLGNQVYLSIPKIPISRTHDLTGALGAMGISHLFSERANFSGITLEAPLKVSKVIHKAVLHLDEVGGKAPSATAPSGGLSPGALRDQRPIEIRFTRPFLICIFDNFSWSSLVLAKVTGPA